MITEYPFSILKATTKITYHFLAYKEDNVVDLNEDPNLVKIISVIIVSYAGEKKFHKFESAIMKKEEATEKAIKAFEVASRKSIRDRYEQKNKERYAYEKSLES